MHIPVLLKEVIQWLDPQPGQKFIDATINGGGHALALVEKIIPAGKLLGIERDPEVLKILKLRAESLKVKDSVILVNDNYANIEKIAGEYGLERADGVLFDLGVSSWHFEESGRGFSFRREEPLDMRFNPSSGISAMEIVNTWPEKDLIGIIREYGEERLAGRIAKAIVETRRKKAITTSAQLARVVEGAVARRGRIHPATKTFQALRMAVNDELNHLRQGLEAAERVLKSGGRLAVISFHGLEDKAVKTFFREEQKRGVIKILTKKVIKPAREEIKNNPRSRSAKMRVLQKL